MSFCYKVWAYTVSKLCWFLAVIIGITFIPYLVRKITKKKVTILYYHSPSPDIFVKHIIFLKKRYNFIDINQLSRVLTSNHLDQLPYNPLLITFDDGHKQNFTLLNICMENGIRPTIYLCSQIVGTYRGFWSGNIPSSEREHLKSFDAKTREKILKERYDFGFEDEQRQRTALSLQEIKSMSPYFDFGSHTRFHEILTTCDDLMCKEEILYSKKELEQVLGQECSHFSYPNGDYTDREVEMVQQAGYLTARTIDLGWNGQDTNPFRLKGIPVQDNASIRVLAGQLTAIPQYLTRLLVSGELFGKHKQIVIDMHKIKSRIGF
jgi:peptidoglycan/xylan/chitin deacetylase (PgdA/CDA1 family)